MAKKILVTRPIEQARNFAAEIAALGAEAVICPLLDVDYSPLDFSKISKPDAVVLTSSQAVVGRGFPTDWQDLPVFCVGDKTAEAARLAGARNCISGHDGIDGLLPLINGVVPAGRKIVYLCGEQVSRDLGEALPHYQIESVVTYKAKAVEDLSPEEVMSFSQIHTVTLFSPRTGEVLAALMAKYGLFPYAKNINLLCLSFPVLESVSRIEWRSCHVADEPTQFAMIQNLKILIQNQE